MIYKVYFCMVGRILCLDLGQKRTGIAVTDPLGIIPGSLDTIETNILLSFLKEYCQNEMVKTIVVGYPSHLNGQESEMTHFVKEYFKVLKLEFPNILIEAIDERLSSIQAQKIIIQSGIKKSKRKERGLYDKVSAMILLQSYMDKINRK